MYLFFDTETTGVNKNRDHLVQIAWIIAGKNGDVESMECHIIKPDGFHIPSGAARIHGITTATANSQGRPLEDVLEEFSEEAEFSDVVVAHNLSFDVGFLKASYDEIYLDYPLSGKTQICTMKSTTSWCGIPKPSGKPGYKWPKLEELHYQLFGHSFDNAHNALADAEACMRCYFELVSREVLEPPAGGHTITNPAAGATKPLAKTYAPSSVASDRSGEEIREGEYGDVDLDDYLTRLRLVLDPKTAVGILFDIAEYGDLEIALILAKNSELFDDELVEEAFCKLSEAELKIVACDPGILESALPIVLRCDDGLEEDVLKNPKCNSQIVLEAIDQLEEDLEEAGLTEGEEEYLIGWQVTGKDGGVEDRLLSILQHPQCPADYLSFWARRQAIEWYLDDDDPIVEAIINNSNVRPETLGWVLAVTPHLGAAYSLIWRHPQFSVAVAMDGWHELMEDLESDLADEKKMALRYAQWEKCNPDILCYLSENGDITIVDLALKNLSHPIHLALSVKSDRNELDELTGCDSRHVRQAVLKNLNVDSELVACLADDDCAQVRAEVASHSLAARSDLNNLALDERAIVRMKVAENENTDISTLKSLAFDKHEDVRLKVAKREQDGASFLEQLAKDSSSSVRCAIAANGCTSISTLKVLASDSSSSVRWQLANNPRCPTESQIVLCQDSDPKVRIRVTENKNCRVEVVWQLSNDPIYEWRILAAKHAMCDLSTFEKLEKDPIKFVRKAVMNNKECPLDIRARLYAAKNKDKLESDF